jgi:hypothetical protein
MIRLFAVKKGALNLLIYGSTIAAFERENGITRGEAKSILSASAFGEYFPNPGPKQRTVDSDDFGILLGCWKFFDTWLCLNI